jgi:hypothetical protein
MKTLLPLTLCLLLTTGTAGADSCALIGCLEEGYVIDRGKCACVRKEQLEVITLTNVQIHATEKFVKEYQADKWREKCDEYIGYYEYSPTEQSVYMEIATAYCTRAILEELKK